MQDPLAAAIIGDDRAGQQCDEPGIPPAVEEQAGNEQPAHGPVSPGDAAKQEETRERSRQEAQDEFRRIEQHDTGPALSGSRHNQE